MGQSSAALTGVELAKQVLAEKFSVIKVNQIEVEKAENALARVAVTNYEENMIHDITLGLKVD